MTPLLLVAMCLCGLTLQGMWSTCDVEIGQAPCSQSFSESGSRSGSR